MDDKLNLDSLLDNLFDGIEREMGHKNISLSDALKQIRTEIGSDVADPFEEWYGEGS